MEGIVGVTVDKNKGPAIGVEQEFAVERIGETKAMVVMAQLVILGDTRVFYQVIYNTNKLDNPVPGKPLRPKVQKLIFILNL